MDEIGQTSGAVKRDRSDSLSSDLTTQSMHDRTQDEGFLTCDKRADEPGKDSFRSRTNVTSVLVFFLCAEAGKRFPVMFLSVSLICFMDFFPVGSMNSWFLLIETFQCSPHTEKLMDSKHYGCCGFGYNDNCSHDMLSVVETQGFHCTSFCTQWRTRHWIELKVWICLILRRCAAGCLSCAVIPSWLNMCTFGC